MSRDFTPQMLHVSDASLHFSQESLVMTNPRTGERTVLHDPKCAEAIRWPNAYFLAQRIVEDYQASPEKLDYFEQILAKILELDDNEKDVCAAMATPFEKTVYEWYIGRLDPWFYYSEENTRLMSDALGSLVLPEPEQD